MIWDLKNGSSKRMSMLSMLQDFSLPTGPRTDVQAVALSPDGRLAASGEVGFTRPPSPIPDVSELTQENRQVGAIYLWDSLAAKPEWTPVPILAYLEVNGNTIYLGFPDEKHLVSVQSSGIIQVWKVREGKEYLGKKVKGFRHGAVVRSAAMSLDGKRLISGSRNAAKVWDLGTGMAKTYKGTAGEDFDFESPTDGFTAVAISGDGRRIAIGFSDGRIRIKDVGELSGEEIFDGKTGPTAKPAQRQVKEKIFDEP